jgi:hypothetical protein
MLMMADGTTAEISEIQVKPVGLAITDMDLKALKREE